MLKFFVRTEEVLEVVADIELVNMEKYTIFQQQVFIQQLVTNRTQMTFRTG
jgi:hypothetical protein